MPYAISSEFNSTDRNKIVEVLDKLSSLTCVKFRPRTQADKDYVEYVVGTGCASFVGRNGNGRQIISLGEGCVYTNGIAHESMHALGFWHEHTRPDRDKYIKVFWKNVDPDKAHNFVKQIDSIVSREFDYNSAMLYGPRTFGVHARAVTIMPLDASKMIYELWDPRKPSPISSGDIEAIGRLYKCF